MINKKYVSKMLLATLLALVMLFTGVSFVTQQSKQSVNATVGSPTPVAMTATLGNSTTVNFYPVFDSSNPLPSGVKFYTLNGTTYTQLISDVDMPTLTMATLGTALGANTLYYTNESSTPIKCVQTVDVNWNYVFDSTIATGVASDVSSYFKSQYLSTTVYTDSSCTNWDGAITSSAPTVNGISYVDIYNAYSTQLSSNVWSSNCKDFADASSYNASASMWTTTSRATSTGVVLIQNFGKTNELDVDDLNMTMVIGSARNLNTNDKITFNIASNLTNDEVTVHFQGNTYTIARGASQTFTIPYNNMGAGYKNSTGHIYIDYEYTINYDANGGSITSEYSNEYSDIAVVGCNTYFPNTQIYTIAQTGYVFKGWALTNEATEALDSYTVSATDDTDNDYVITLYAVWAPIISEQPDETNDYTVIVDDSISGESYQWQKRSYSWSNAVQDGLYFCNYSNGYSPQSNTVSASSHCYFKVDTGTNLRFKFSGTGTVGNNVTDNEGTHFVAYEADEDGYYYPTYVPNEEYRVVYVDNIVSGAQFTDIEVYGNFVDISGETYAGLSTANEDNNYRCIVILENGDTVISNVVTPIDVSFDGNGETDGSVATMYQLEGKEITLPMGTSFTKQNGEGGYYDFLYWYDEDNETYYQAGETYTVNTKTTLYAVWGYVRNNISFNIPLTQDMIDEYITDDNHSLSAGNYYLTENITLPTYVIVAPNAEVNLFLRGKIINLGGLDSNGNLKNSGIFNLQNNGQMYICDDIYTNTNIKYFTIDSSTGLWKYTSNVTSNYVYGGLITGGNAYDADADCVSNGGAIENAGNLTIRNINIVGNIAEGDGGAIYNTTRLSGFYTNFGKINIYHTTFKGNVIRLDNNNKPQGNGGAIYTMGRVLLQDCNVSYNRADYGGGVYSMGITVTTINTIIQNNNAYTLGGGVYMHYESGCLIAGTKITMANGTTKNIEDIVEGDMVKTFDHETGAISSERVCYVYKGIDKRTAFTLHFTNNIDLSVVVMHTFLEKSSLKYVTITQNNVNNYIGKYFYNANNARWERLQSVTKSSTKYDYYAITTAHHLNNITNNMLSSADDTEDSLNVFDFDSNLQINQAKKQADIKKYGLFSYSQCTYASQQEFDDYNMQYLNIIIGKGYATIEELTHTYRGNVNYLYNNSNVSGSSVSSIKSSNLSGMKAIMVSTMDTDITCDDYVDEDKIELIIGQGTQINSNTCGTNTTSNVYLNQGSDTTTSIRLIANTDKSTINIGVEMSSGYGDFATDVANNEYLSSFSSDDSHYVVTTREVDTDSYTYRLSCNHNGVIFDTPLSQSTIDDNLDASNHYIFTTGNYYLTEDITLSNYMYVNNGVTVNICLNGHLISHDGDVRIIVSSGGVLNFYDCGTNERHWSNNDTTGRWEENAEGEYTTTGGAFTVTGEGANKLYTIIWLEGGTCNIDGVDVIGCYVHANSIIFYIDSNSTFSIKNSNIKGNTENNSASTEGKIIYGLASTITLENVNIEYNYLRAISEFSSNSTTINIGNNVVVRNNYDRYNNPTGTVGFNPSGKLNNDNIQLTFTSSNPTGIEITLSIVKTGSMPLNFMVTSGTTSSYLDCFTLSTYHSESLPTLPYFTASGDYSYGYKLRNKVVDNLNYIYLSKIYHLTYSATDATSGTVPVDSTEYFAGDVVTLVGNTGNLTKDYYRFNGWATNAMPLSTPVAQITINSDTTVYANWYNLTIVFDNTTGLFYYEDKYDDENLGNSVVCTDVSGMYSYNSVTNTIAFENFIYDAGPNDAVTFNQFINLEVIGNNNIITSSRSALLFESSGKIFGNGTFTINGELYISAYDNDVNQFVPFIIEDTTISIVYNYKFGLDFVGPLNVLSGNITISSNSNNTDAKYAVRGAYLMDTNAIFEWNNGDGNAPHTLVYIENDDDVFYVTAYIDDDTLVSVTSCIVSSLQITNQPTLENNFELTTNRNNVTYQWYKKGDVTYNPQVSDFVDSVFGMDCPITKENNSLKISSDSDLELAFTLTDNIYSIYQTVTFKSPVQLSTYMDNYTLQLISTGRDENDNIIYYEYKCVINMDYMGYYFVYAYPDDDLTEPFTVYDVTFLTDKMVVTDATSSTYTPTEEGDYYCVASISNANRQSNTIFARAVSFNNKSGTGTMSKIVKYSGESVTLPANTLTKTGFKFMGWDTASTATTVVYADIANYTFTDEDITLYAVWEVNTYTITYNLNNGINNINNPATYNVETETFSIQSPTRENYQFVGWYSDEGLTTPATTTITIGSVGDLTFYAKWTPIAYTITYNLNNGINNTNNPATYNIETETFSIQNPTREGYRFMGWYSDESLTTPATTTITIGSVGNLTFYARWELCYSIVYKANGGKGNVPIDNNQYIVNESVSIDSSCSLVKANYKFIGWNIEQSSSNTISSYNINSTDAVDTIISLYAVWQAKLSVTINETPQVFKAIDTNIKFSVDSALQNFVVEYCVNDTWTTTVPTSVGVYDVRVTRAEDANFAEFSRVVSGGLVINKVPNTIDNFKQENIVEGNKINPSAICTYGHIIYYYRLASDTEYILLTEDNYPTEVGKYVLKAVVLASDNYESAECELEFEITEDKSLPIWVWILIAVVALIAIAILLFFNTKRTVTFIVDGKELATIKAKQNANLNMYGELLSYIWYTDKNLTKVFISNKVGYKNLTLYGQKAKGRKK